MQPTNPDYPQDGEDFEDLPTGDLFVVSFESGKGTKGSRSKDSRTLTLTLNAPEIVDIDERRAPMDCVCVVDTSKSMTGGFSIKGRNKLAQALNCFQHFITYLGDMDRFSVYLFALETKKLFGLTPMNSLNRWTVAATLVQECNHPDGGTDIMKAVITALEDLASPERAASSNGRAASIWLFTDGQDVKVRERTSPTNNLPIGVLSDAEVDEKLQALISSYEKRIQGGFSINCFGFGEMNDDLILSKLAEHGHGTYYYVKSTEPKQQEQEFVQYFSDCLHRKLTLVAQNVSIPPSLGKVRSLVGPHDPSDLTVSSVGDVYHTMVTHILWDVSFRSLHSRPSTETLRLSGGTAPGSGSGRRRVGEALPGGRLPPLEVGGSTQGTPGRPPPSRVLSSRPAMMSEAIAEEEEGVSEEQGDVMEGGEGDEEGRRILVPVEFEIVYYNLLRSGRKEKQTCVFKVDLTNQKLLSENLVKEYRLASHLMEDLKVLSATKPTSTGPVPSAQRSEMLGQISAVHTRAISFASRPVRAKVEETEPQFRQTFQRDELEEMPNCRPFQCEAEPRESRVEPGVLMDQLREEGVAMLEQEMKAVLLAFAGEQTLRYRASLEETERRLFGEMDARRSRFEEACVQSINRTLANTWLAVVGELAELRRQAHEATQEIALLLSLARRHVAALGVDIAGAAAAVRAAPPTTPGRGVQSAGVVCGGQGSLFPLVTPTGVGAVFPGKGVAGQRSGSSGAGEAEAGRGPSARSVTASSDELSAPTVLQPDDEEGRGAVSEDSTATPVSVDARLFTPGNAPHGQRGQRHRSRVKAGCGAGHQEGGEEGKGGGSGGKEERGAGARKARERGATTSNPPKASQRSAFLVGGAVGAAAGTAGGTAGGGRGGGALGGREWDEAALRNYALTLTNEYMQGTPSAGNVARQGEWVARLDALAGDGGGAEEEDQAPEATLPAGKGEAPARPAGPVKNQDAAKPRAQQTHTGRTGRERGVREAKVKGEWRKGGPNGAGAKGALGSSRKGGAPSQKSGYVPRKIGVADLDSEGEEGNYVTDATASPLNILSSSSGVSDGDGSSEGADNTPPDTPSRPSGQPLFASSAVKGGVVSRRACEAFSSTTPSSQQSEDSSVGTRGDVGTPSRPTPTSRRRNRKSKQKKNQARARPRVSPSRDVDSEEETGSSDSVVVGASRGVGRSERAVLLAAQVARQGRRSTGYQPLGGASARGVAGRRKERKKGPVEVEMEEEGREQEDSLFAPSVSLVSRSPTPVGRRKRRFGRGRKKKNPRTSKKRRYRDEEEEWEEEDDKEEYDDDEDEDEAAARMTCVFRRWERCKRSKVASFFFVLLLIIFVLVFLYSFVQFMFLSPSTQHTPPYLLSSE